MPPPHPCQAYKSIRTCPPMTDKWRRSNNNDLICHCQPLHQLICLWKLIPRRTPGCPRRRRQYEGGRGKLHLSQPLLSVRHTRISFVICRTYPHTLCVFPTGVSRFLITPPYSPSRPNPLPYLLYPSLSSCAIAPSLPPVTPVCRN